MRYEDGAPLKVCEGSSRALYRLDVGWLVGSSRVEVRVPRSRFLVSSMHHAPSAAELRGGQAPELVAFKAEALMMARSARASAPPRLYVEPLGEVG